MDKKAVGIIAIGLVVAALIVDLVPMVSSLSLTRPVAAGGLVSVQVWKYPVGASSNKPRRRYRHLTHDLYLTHDGKLLSIADGKLIMKSKDGTEHSYTLADTDQSAGIFQTSGGGGQIGWLISYNTGETTVEGLKALLADPATPVIVPTK